MKLVIQRVSRASVIVEGDVVGKIGHGLALLLGIEQGDTAEQARQLAAKVLKIRLWPDLKDATKQWASSVVDNGFELLVVSQFTLFATFKKPKPDFHQAMGGDEAKTIYEEFVGQCRKALKPGSVATGIFGAMMQVDICNEGPVTVELVATPPSSVQSAPKAPPAADAQQASATSGALPPAVAPQLDHAAVNAKLEDQSYLSGFVPSQLDAEHFDAVKVLGPPPAQFANLLRWYEHMMSFSDGERTQWLALPAAAT